MSAPAVSVVIVSHGRPTSLRLCLEGVTRLRYSAFEIVVVADAAGIAAIDELPGRDRVKSVAFEEQNISAARNLGIAAAAGEIVAFIDDDAVPEPTWLMHLASGFDLPGVAAAGGYVRGRNGISFQWRARVVSDEARHRDLDIDGDEARVPQPPEGWAPKLEGTNMAIRREVLARIGGFDPAFRFFLDETDLSLRLAAARQTVAVVPLAEVHHAFAASPRRAPDRAVRDLFEIGASMAVFLRKHCAEAEARAARWHGFQGEQGARLRDQVRRRLISTGEVEGLMRGLREGYEAGLARNIAPLSPLAQPDTSFRPYPTRTRGPTTVISGRTWQVRRLRRAAVAAAERGEVATLILLSPTTLFHRLRFVPEGYWEQRGGVFGRSDRAQPLLRLTGFRRRVAEEVARVARQRGIDADL
ncbi:glycosyltransferase family 2 protein [Stappia sp.]|uniref:glycosyltransferase family 2 protein n=1 Tax=Stappia sp. TaxID=1870903 RepID=UPI003A992EFB